MIKKQEYLILQVMLCFISLIAFTGCLAKVEEQEEYILIEKDYITNEFLKKWNKVIYQEIRNEFPEERMVLENIKYDSLNSHGATRGEFLISLKQNRVFSDSIPYNHIYVLELEVSGERDSYYNYLIIDKNEIDYYYQFEYGISSGWTLKRKGKGDFTSVIDLYNNIVGKEMGGQKKGVSSLKTVVLSKLNPDKIAAKYILHPTEVQKDSIVSFTKRLYAGQWEK